jgi:2,4-dienoyl-CoA reductase-like NADH-dependent reductase (Old Yellow Enzyme family)
MLFDPGRIGTLELPNRLVRSATAERMASADGKPLPSLLEVYRELIRGEIGLLITGHMFIHSSGKCHSEMTAIDRDDCVPALKKVVEAVHQENGSIVVQINHGGSKCSPEVLENVIAPSAMGENSLTRPAKEMSLAEIQNTISYFAKAARRAQDAGFDGVQIHSAHGYLNSQFLSPLTNHRQDEWGGSLTNRSRFIKKVCLAVREEVGSDYPVLIKFGISDGIKGGFTLQEGLSLVSQFESWGLDGIEISSGFSGELFSSIQQDIDDLEDEGYFLDFTHQAKSVSSLPILAVGGFRSREVMENALKEGKADYISLCRPLIREPLFPVLLKSGKVDASDCLSANLCWAEKDGEGISCKCY